MADRQLLATFEVEISGKETRFSIYGEYEMAIKTDYKNRVFNYPEFDNLLAKQTVGGREEDYEPEGASWAGRRYSVYDMIHGFLTSMIQDRTEYKKIFLEPKLQEVVDSYLSADKIVTVLNDRKVARWILFGGLDVRVYELSLVTDQFIYYNHYDECLMLASDDHGIVSDNYFAEYGYFESVENIKSGKETLLWGEFPDDH